MRWRKYQNIQKYVVKGKYRSCYRRRERQSFLMMRGLCLFAYTGLKLIENLQKIKERRSIKRWEQIQH